MLTDKDLEHLAALARIKLNENEKEGLQKDLISILDYVETLNEVNVAEIEPLSQTTGIENAFRNDEERPQFKTDPGIFTMNEDLNSKLIDQAPQKEKRFIKVKSILNRNKK